MSAAQVATARFCAQAVCASGGAGFRAAAARPPIVARPSFAGQPLSVSGSSSAAAASRQLWAPAAAAAARRRVQRRSAVVPPTAAAASVPALDSLDMLPILSTQGYVNPEIPEGTEVGPLQATVFAVYDEAKILQYVGFSKGLRDSLRTLFSRRPEKAHYYRALHLPKLDQQQMVDIRAAWFDGNYGPPPGNKLPHERDQWQLAPEGHVISERGKMQAAVELSKQLQQRIKQRGCREEFVPSADMLEQGKVEFLPAAALSAEELERQRLAAEEAAKSTRTVQFVMDGAPASFDLFFVGSLKTNGGWMYDVVVTFQDKETSHRVIVGRDYYEPQGIDPQTTVERVFAFLLRKKVPRQTEGMLLSSQFTSNYFSISQVEQNFDDFAADFAELGRLPGADAFWRFNRLKDYGLKGDNETPEQLKATFG